ncbi:MAG: M81 family metallopeptidase [Betaproteobacteria bacterium]|nr:M81 family metallopeptidase [Betaproteobacteria bacterium]
MPRRYVIALIKHETNTFSPLATPLASFGHGNGPAFGDAARARFAGTNTPMAAYLDLARREGAEIVTPVAAESWPSNKASRQTFETLVQPLETAVRAGCDAVFLDLHGAMVIEDCDDAEGEIVARIRRIAPRMPIAVTLDYHTNLSRDLVENATVVTGYKTYPHVDMYEAGHLAGELLVRALDGRIEPVMAWGWKPLLASIMRHAPEDGPSGDILAYARQMEANGTVLAATLLPSFPHADTKYTGVSAIVVGDARKGGRESARTVCDHMLAIAWERRAEYAFRAPPLAESVARAKALGLTHPGAPVLLIDHCDNCGSGGAQDVMDVVAEILVQELDDVAIAPIRDASAVATMIDAGAGQKVKLNLGGNTDMAAIGQAGMPLAVEGRVQTITDGEFTITGPMYTGVKTYLGRTAVLEVKNERARAQIVITERPHEPFDVGVFTHAGIDPTKKRYLMLKSRIHYRAGFKPIASHIVECAGSGVTNADLSVYRYEKLTRPIYPLDPI